MKRLLAHYTNGNYDVILLEDGTKIRHNNLDNLTPSFAESIDCTITTKCDGGCEYCYLGCNVDGVHADLNQPFFDTLHRGQELALNGNDLTHPELVGFLTRMKEKGVICNLTVNQRHFLRYPNHLKALVDADLIHGIGISLTDSSDERLYKELKRFPNAVIHTIDVLLTKEDIDLLLVKSDFDGKKVRDAIYLADEQRYIANYMGWLIRCIEYTVISIFFSFIRHNIKYLGDNIDEIAKHFAVISFDNLSLQHLDIKSKLSEKEWDALYMGDEGQYTFFIDAVNKKFAVSSLTEEKYDLMDSVDDMFRKVGGVA